MYLLFLLQIFAKYGIIVSVRNMNEDFLNLSLDELYDELIHYNISLEEVASEYEIASENVKYLEKALKSYCRACKLPLPEQLSAPEKFFDEQDEKVLHLYKEEHMSIKQISESLGMSTYLVSKVIDRFKQSGYIETTKKNTRPESYDVKKIIEDLNNGSTYLDVMKTYSIPRDKLRTILSTSPEGKEILEKRADRSLRSKKDISVEDAVKAFLTDTYDIASPTTIRKILVRFYGEEYKKILRKQESVYTAEDIVKLYLDSGDDIEKIAKNIGKTSSRINSKINEYYKKLKIKKPKIISKDNFETYLKNQPSFDIEEAIKYYEEQNVHIPEAYIQEYLKKSEEIDLRKVRSIVNGELTKLSKEGKSPNYVEPYLFAKTVKAKGYNTKYQATALLYKTIVDNDLSTQIAEELDDEEVQTSLHLLIDYDKTDKIGFLRKLEKNKIAQLIYTMQNQTSNPDTEKTIED